MAFTMHVLGAGQPSRYKGNLQTLKHDVALAAHAVVSRCPPPALTRGGHAALPSSGPFAAGKPMNA